MEITIKNIDQDGYWDVKEMVYDIKQEVSKQIVKSMCIGTLPKHPTEILAEELMNDPETRKLMDQRKEQIKEMMRKEIEEYITSS